MPAQNNNKRLASPPSLNSYIKSVCDIMRRDNCKGALEYVPELTWMLFLRILDEREEKEEPEARALGYAFTPTLKSPYRWRDWGDPDGERRKALQAGTMGGFLRFVNEELLENMRSLGKSP